MLKKIFFILALTLISAFSSLSATQAQIINDTLTGLDETAGSIPAFQNQVSSYDNNFLATKTGQIIGIILSFVGVVFLILMIYAGILWMTARGNEQQVSKAKDLLINATIGMIIVFSAYALTTFLGAQLLQ